MSINESFWWYMKELSVNLFKQEHKIYCGAASVQMILGYINGWGRNQEITQTQLNKMIKVCNREKSWDADPNGVLGCLNKLSLGANRWKVCIRGDQAQKDAIKAIMENIDNYSRPSAALVDGGNQWVVVCGFKSKRNFLGETSEIIDFRILNPELKNKKVIPYKEWCDEWFTLNKRGKKYFDKYVSILYRKPPAKKKQLSVKRILVK